MSGKLLNHTLLVRTLSAAVFVAVVVGAILWSQWSFGALVTLIAAGCLWEFYRLAGNAGTRPQKWFGMILGVMLVGGGWLCMISDASLPLVMVMAVVPLTFAVFIVELYRRTEQPLLNVAATVGGLLYTAVPLLLFVVIAFRMEEGGREYQRWAVLAYFLIVWMNDTGAYLVGVAFGRHRLMERISPKKSWEGFFGGIAAAVATALLSGHWMGHAGTALWAWGGLGLVVAVSGVWGDLVESMFKRSVGVKDSGSIMPGHGGFLDRFDALLLSLPFAAVYYFILLHLF